MTVGAWQTTVLPVEVLVQLHQALRGRDGEAEVWSALVAVSAEPLPPAIAHDLIARGIALAALAHSRQADDVQWRLARVCGGEALLTLGLELYTRPERGPDEFERLLAAFPDDTWLFDTLVRRVGSSPDKEGALLAAATRHPNAVELARLDRVRRQALRASDSAVSEQEIADLYATGEPRIWLALAANPGTPERLLNVLMDVKGVKQAAEIRSAARRTLHRRR